MRTRHDMPWLAVVVVLALGNVSAQDAADWTSDEDILYYLAAGHHSSGRATFGVDNTGQNQTDFFGCVHLYLRENPRQDAGRTQVIARLGNELFHFDFNSFSGELEDMDGGLARDVYVDGSHVHVGEIQHPAVLAGMAGWGHGALTMGVTEYPDPATGSSEFQASMFVTGQGFRDDKTGAIRDRDGGLWQPGEHAQLGKDDWEIHLRIESPNKPQQPDEVYTSTQPSGTASYFAPQEGYAATYLFDNVRYGGAATIAIDMESLARAGDNHLTFTFRDPLGATIDQVVLEPSALSPATHRATVPLDMFGKYSMAVSGTVSLSSYTFTLTQHTPAKFDMDLWWDNVTFGRASTQTLWDCQDEVGYAEELVANVVSRVPPPPFEWVPIGFGVAATVLGVLAAGKLIHMSWSAGRKL